MDYLLNIKICFIVKIVSIVLNLIINGLPSKPMPEVSYVSIMDERVLNLIINGLPSKQKK